MKTETTDPAQQALNAVTALCTPDPADAKAVIYAERYGEGTPPVYAPKDKFDEYCELVDKTDNCFSSGDPTWDQEYLDSVEELKPEHLEKLISKVPLAAILRGPIPNRKTKP
jgi:hypothetical protein